MRAISYERGTPVATLVCLPPALYNPPISRTPRALLVYSSRSIFSCTLLVYFSREPVSIGSNTPAIP